MNELNELNELNKMNIEMLTLEELSRRIPIGELKTKYLTLLSFLSDSPFVTNDEFETQMNKITRLGVILVCIVRDNDNIKIIGSGTLLFEPKLSHGCNYVGHIEDIVVDPDYRGLHIASTILSKLKDLSKPYCYKVILECKEEIKEFYEKNEFVSSNLFVMKYNENNDRM